MLPITNELLILARNTYQSYKNYLDEEHHREEILKKEGEKRAAEEMVRKEKAKAADRSYLKTLLTYLQRQ